MAWADGGVGEKGGDDQRGAAVESFQIGRHQHLHTSVARRDCRALRSRSFCIGRSKRVRVRVAPALVAAAMRMAAPWGVFSALALSHLGMLGWMWPGKRGCALTTSSYSVHPGEGLRVDEWVGEEGTSTPTAGRKKEEREEEARRKARRSKARNGNVVQRLRGRKRGEERWR